jgi:hypothetical protein
MGEPIVIFPPAPPCDFCACYSGWAWLQCQYGFQPPCSCSSKAIQMHQHAVRVHQAEASGVALGIGLMAALLARRLRKMF